MKFRTVWIIANILVLIFGLSGYAYKQTRAIIPFVKEGSTNPLPNKPEPPLIKNSIIKATPSYLNYNQTVTQLQEWNKEAPEITEITIYGKSSQDKDLVCFRIFNKQAVKNPKVLITACIHGNEPLASSTVMWYIGTILDKYNKEESIRQLVDSRDLYFVPVLSPDSYPNSRFVDGVDPNRDFPGPKNTDHISCAPVLGIQNLFNKIQPNSVVSCHTWGRCFLVPFGDTMQKCPDHESIMTVMNKVKVLSNYRCIRACEMYGKNGGLNNPPIRIMGKSRTSMPIFGIEVDWFYRHGAFAVVMEMGTHQRIPSDTDIRTEFDMTFSSFLLFVKEAPLVKLKTQLNPK